MTSGRENGQDAALGMEQGSDEREGHYMSIRIGIEQLGTPDAGQQDVETMLAMPLRGCSRAFQEGCTDMEPCLVLRQKEI